MTIPNELFSDYVIQYLILGVHFISLIHQFVFISSLDILAYRLNASILTA